MHIDKDIEEQEKENEEKTEEAKLKSSSNNRMKLSKGCWKKMKKLWKRTMKNVVAMTQKIVWKIPKFVNKMLVDLKQIHHQKRLSKITLRRTLLNFQRSLVVRLCKRNVLCLVMTCQWQKNRMKQVKPALIKCYNFYHIHIQNCLVKSAISRYWLDLLKGQSLTWCNETCIKWIPLGHLTNRMWFSVVYSLIDSDTHHHSGQNVVDSRGTAEWVCNKFWPLWWCVSLSIRLYTVLNHVQFVFLPQYQRNEIFVLTIENADSDLKVHALHYAN